MEHFNLYDYKILLNKFGLFIKELDINTIEQFRGNEKKEPFIRLKNYDNEDLIFISIEQKEAENINYYQLKAIINSEFLLNDKFKILNTSFFKILNTYNYFYKNIFKEDFYKNKCTIFSKFHDKNTSPIFLKLNYSDLEFKNLLSFSYNSKFLEFIDNYLNDFSINVKDYEEKNEKSICDLIKIINY